jgi:hypothetical protein
MKQGDEAQEGRGTAITVLLPNLLLIVLGLTMVAVGAGLAARNQWVGLLLLVVGLGGPGFQGATHLWPRPR